MIKCRYKKDHERYGNLIPVRYLKDTANELYSNYPFKNEISLSTFRKYLKITGEFKKPHRLTDLCDWCEWAKKTKDNIIRLLRSENYQFEQEFDLEKTYRFFLANLKSHLGDSRN